MKVGPILFSGSMPRAILRPIDPKNQTRRPVKGLPLDATEIGYWAPPSGKSQEGWAKPGLYFRDQDGLKSIPCPYGQPGDRLYVKEAAWMWCLPVPDGLTKSGRQKLKYSPMHGAPIAYVADNPLKPTAGIVSPPENYRKWGWRYKPGRFMPRRASRILLEITHVRAQRVQEISEQDAKAEGVDGIFDDWVGPGNRTYRKPFNDLWDSINAATGCSWLVNPWVWALTFRRLDGISPK